MDLFHILLYHVEDSPASIYVCRHWDGGDFHDSGVDFPGK